MDSDITLQKFTTVAGTFYIYKLDYYNFLYFGNPNFSPIILQHTLNNFIVDIK